MADELKKMAEQQYRQTILLLEVVGLLHDLGKLSDGFLKSQAEDGGGYQYAHKLLANPAKAFTVPTELMPLTSSMARWDRWIVYLESGVPTPLVGAATSMANELRMMNPPAKERDVDKRICEVAKKIMPASEVEAFCRLGKAAVELGSWLAEAADGNVGTPFKERADLTEILSRVSLRWNGKAYTLAELLPATRPRHTTMDWKPWLDKSMEPALLIGHLHGPAHVEKEEASPENRQFYQKTYRSSPFGVEKHMLVESCANLTLIQKALPLNRITNVLTGKRQEWLREMQTLMECGVGDTRRPTNEVTLWDWGYTVACMTKAALPSIILRGTDLTNLAWRVLSVNVDLLGLYARAHKITDLLGTRKAVEIALDNVKRLLEESYPLANELYRGSTGIYFLFPDFNLEDWLKEEIQNCFDPDFSPIIRLSRPIRAADLDPKGKDPVTVVETARQLIAEPRREAQKALKFPVTAENLPDWQAVWEKAEGDEICTTCGLRPVGYPPQGDAEEKRLEPWATIKKAKERNVCRICLDRRGRRAKAWATNEDMAFARTVWADEATDANGQACLLVGSFDLDGWLDGTLLATLPVTQKSAKNPSPARLRRIWQTTQSFWEKVEDHVLPQAVGERGPRLILTAANVSELDLGGYHAYELKLGPVSLSVVWSPDTRGNGHLITADNLHYLAKLLDEKLPEQAEGETELAYLLRAYQEAVKCVLKRLNAGQLIPIEELRGYGATNISRGTLQGVIARVTGPTVGSLETYTPVIPLLTEPTTFMAIVPADRALAVAQKVRNEYIEQMGKVRDRLPLLLGLVYFPRRTPIRAVLEAGRAMLAMAGKWHWEEWEVVAADPAEPGKLADVTHRKLEFDNGVTWEVPVVMGDETTSDQWYPRFLAQKPVRGKELDVRHVDSLKEQPVDGAGRPVIKPGRQDWKVWVRPSCFDFEFLDTTARRFEISYDVAGRRRGRTKRPYLLDELPLLEEAWQIVAGVNGLTASQIHAMWEDIEAKRQAWDDVETFRKFVRQVLLNAGWKQQPANIDQLEKWGVSGLLSDVLELYLSIMKASPARKGESE